MPVLLGRCIPVTGGRIVVVRVGGHDQRLLRARATHTLQVAGDLRVRLVVVPQLGVQVRGRTVNELVVAGAVGQVDAHCALRLLGRLVNER